MRSAKPNSSSQLLGVCEPLWHQCTNAPDPACYCQHPQYTDAHSCTGRQCTNGLLHLTCTYCYCTGCPLLYSLALHLILDNALSTQTLTLRTAPTHIFVVATREPTHTFTIRLYSSQIRKLISGLQQSMCSSTPLYLTMIVFYFYLLYYSNMCFVVVNISMYR